MTTTRTIAIHESGHTIAAWSLGVKVVSIALDSTTGRVRTRCPEQTIDEIERSLIVTLAGPIAERMLIGEPDDDSVFRGDRKDERELTEMLAERTNLLEADLRALACEQYAERIVKRNRKAIEGLAKQLMRETQQ